MDSRNCESDHEGCKSIHCSSFTEDFPPSTIVPVEIVPKSKKQRTDGGDDETSFKVPVAIGSDPIVCEYSQLPERPCSLPKEILSSMVVLSQVDKKFIIAVHKGFVFAFDQHAVHELLVFQSLASHFHAHIRVQ